MKGSFRYERRFLEALARRPGDFRRAAASLDRRIVELYLSAHQSAVFNRVLAARMPEIGRVRAGDAAWIHAKGACFIVQDPGAEAPRAERFEISPSGPLHGPRMLEPQGEPGALERRLLGGEAFDYKGLQSAFRIRLRGARRPLRVPLAEPDVRDEGGGRIRIGFLLPPGAYATTVLREVMKISAAGSAESREA